MSRAKNTNAIVIHCSAGFGDIESMKKFWRETLGWNTPGYHIVVDLNGNIHQLVPFENQSNGVAGNNASIINICYIGGVENFGKNKAKQTIYRAKDTRTEAQKYGILKAISRAINWLEENGKDTSQNLSVVGHRDFSKDQDGNGIIATWERIKECPSFDAMKEYIIFTSFDRKNILPTVKKLSVSTVVLNNFKIHTVVPGDTLGKISKTYSKSVATIKELNGLATDVIKVGQKLKV